MVCISQRFVPYPVSFSRPPGTPRCKSRFSSHTRYDGLHRLVDMQRGRLTAGKDAIETSTLAFAQQWQLDETGNWPNFKEDEDGDQAWNLEQDRTHNPGNEITDITNTTGPPWITPAYDPAGNMTTIPKPAVLGEPLTATYDAWNRLVKIEEPDGQGGLRTLQKNAYDGRNFRIVRQDFADGSLQASSHLYYTNQWQVIEQRQGATPDTAPAERQFIWGQRYIDDLILRDRDTTADTTLDERLYALQDANWNVVALVHPTGDPLERYVYSAYGVVTVYDGTWTNTRSESSYANVTLYTGRELDGETGLYHYRNRYYNTELGRFVTRDPLQTSENLYAYAYHQPTGILDWSGLQATCFDLHNDFVYTYRGGVKVTGGNLVIHYVVRRLLERDFDRRYTRSPVRGLRFRMRQSCEVGWCIMKPVDRTINEMMMMSEDERVMGIHFTITSQWLVQGTQKGFEGMCCPEQ